MNVGWDVTELSSVSTISYGYTESASRDPVGPRFLRITDIQNGSVDWDNVPFCKIGPQDIPRYRLANGDIVFARTGATTGKSFLVAGPPEAVFASYLIRLRLREKKLLPEFVALFFQTAGYWKSIGDGSSGSAQGGFNATKLGALSVPFPPLAEQRRIVGILDEAFAAIANASANSEKNLRSATALFDSVLNAATTGELTREWRLACRSEASAAEHLKQSLEKRRNRWNGASKYSEPQFPISARSLDIPTDWTLASPEQLSTHIVDCPHSTPKWTESGEVCLRTTNFKPGFLDLESVRFVSNETYNERIMRLEPRPGDVVYSREGGILGIACLWPDGLKACLGQRMMQFRVDANVVLPEFFTGVLNSTLILTDVKRLTGGAASPHLNIRDIRTFPIPLPPITEQRAIVEKLDALIAETKRLESLFQRKLAALDELKKSLLHQAFSGQL